MPSEPEVRVAEVVAVELDCAAAEVLAARSLRNELGMDSISAANVLFNLEEELGIDLIPREGDRLDSVADILVLLERSRSQVGA